MVLFYIDKMPLVTRFDITLFADKPYLNLVDKDLSLLKHGVHEKLRILRGKRIIY